MKFYFTTNVLEVPSQNGRSVAGAVAAGIGENALWMIRQVTLLSYIMLNHSVSRFQNIHAGCEIVKSAAVIDYAYHNTRCCIDFD